jgi:hypothetical protein
MTCHVLTRGFVRPLLDGVAQLLQQIVTAPMQQSVHTRSTRMAFEQHPYNEFKLFTAWLLFDAHRKIVVTGLNETATAAGCA